MLDLLLIPSALLVILALRAVRQGEYRLHGHLMAAAVTVVGLRLLLHSREWTPLHLAPWLAAFAMAGTTLLLGRMALAWREGRSRKAAFPHIHRAFGAITLIGLAISTAAWLLRYRS